MVKECGDIIKQCSDRIKHYGEIIKPHGERPLLPGYPTDSYGVPVACPGNTSIFAAQNQFPSLSIPISIALKQEQVGQAISFRYESFLPLFILMCLTGRLVYLGNSAHKEARIFVYPGLFINKDSVSETTRTTQIHRKHITIRRVRHYGV